MVLLTLHRVAEMITLLWECDGKEKQKPAAKFAVPHLQVCKCVCVDFELIRKCDLFRLRRWCPGHQQK